MEYIKLNNGVEMPVLGLGTYEGTDKGVALRSVRDALEVGRNSRLKPAFPSRTAGTGLSRNTLMVKPWSLGATLISELKSYSL